MHKSELEGMTLAELTALAGKLGAELSSDQTTLIYNILDAQSLQATAEPTPKKRGRKPKAAEPAAEEAAVEAATASETPAPKKKRGRKSNAEKAAEAAALAASQEQTEQQQQAEADAPAEPDRASRGKHAAPGAEANAADAATSDKEVTR